MALYGPWKLKNALKIDAIVVVKRVFGGKRDGAHWQSLVQIIDPKTGVVLEELNGPPAPYVEGEDPVRLAYFALAMANRALKCDQVVPDVSEAVVAAFKNESPVGLDGEARRSWWQSVKVFFAPHVD